MYNPAKKKERLSCEILYLICFYILGSGSCWHLIKPCTLLVL